MRALWLMNHSTLRKFEIPMLQEYGFEIFLPKVFPYDEGNLSASVTTELDRTLTIPAEDLAVLNRHNFYTGISSEVKDIVNRHFDVAFFGFFPEQLAALTRNFAGTLVMRPFGLANGVTYTGVTAASLGQFFMSELEKLGSRFWFGQAYPMLADIEHGVYQRRAIHLPLGLDGAKNGKTWVGGVNKILFVCPRIESSPYFNNIYRQFTKNFVGMPYIIGGAQPIQVSDKNVTGFLDRAAYDDLMRRTQVMFYHSQERNHIHYHPFEAVSVGMPLIFMANGMLDDIGGRTLPGRCETIAEARKKLGMVLKGDVAFINDVLSSQDVLLEPMSREFCKPIWDRNFRKVIDSIKENKQASALTTKRKRIAVILPEAYRGGTLDVVKILAKMLAYGAQQRGERVEVVFVHLDSPNYVDSDFSDLDEAGIRRRTIQWDTVTGAQYQDILKLSGQVGVASETEYIVPNDGGNYLLDCDFWFIASDRLKKVVAPLRPYCVFVHDYLQRYFPKLFGENYEYAFIESARQAAMVLANTPHTVEDCIQYAGIAKSRVLMVPHVTNLEKHDVAVPLLNEKFVLWTTNAAPHKNHIQSLTAFDRFFAELEDDGLKVHVTGVGTRDFDPESDYTGESPTVLAVRSFMRGHPKLRNRVVFMGELDERRYSQQVASATLLFHNVTMDNGTLCAIEAAYFNVPTVSSDYPPMRYLSERYALNCTFFDQNDTTSIVEALKSAIYNLAALKQRLPGRQFLQGLGWRAVAGEFWDKLRVYI